MSSTTLDKYAVSASMLCAAHCLFLPIMLSVFPALGTTIFGKESFHVLLLWLVIPLSVIAITLGCKQHKNWLVAMTGALGLAILFFAAIYGHDVLGHEGERVATVIGACVIAAGHLLNYKLCRSAQCQHKLS
ncbi:MAG: MerC domain-containing protein [Pseudomonadota bacterium]